MRRAVRFAEQDSKKEIDRALLDELEESRAVDFLKHYQNRSVTENGAVGYRTTGHPLLDLNFKVSSLRNRDGKFIVDAFVKAYYENWKYAVKWLFFLRDIQEGLGERRTFRICLHHLSVSKPMIASAVMKLVPEYGRFDDLLCLLDTPLRQEACAYMKQQLDADVASAKAGREISLLGKWLPSINTSSGATRHLAQIVAAEFGMSARKYRKTLSMLRRHSDVVEVKISESQWDKIDYEKIPAKANMKYDKAFVRHDGERRVKYLYSVLQESGKLNANGIMPYEIVHKINSSLYGYSLEDDLLAELLWKQISEKGFQNDWGFEDCIVVADGSGSMFSHVSGAAGVRAIDVCNSLAIYFAEQLKGIFHNKAITFSAKPRFIDLEPGRSLRDKLEIMYAYHEVSNTNIEAVFDMLLAMAASSQVPKEEIPRQVLIISDMEFDAATSPGLWGRRDENQNRFDQTLFDAIQQKYQNEAIALRNRMRARGGKCSEVETTLYELDNRSLTGGFQKKLVDAYLKENRTELLDPLNLKKRAEDLLEECMALLKELDTQIKISNATTMLTI